MKYILIGLAVIVSGWLIVNSQKSQYPHGDYNHHVCVEVYQLNEECQ
jgi:hypothetical protein